MVVVSTFFLEGGVGPNGTFERLKLPMEQCRLQRAVATWRVAGCELFYLLLPTGGAPRPVHWHMDGAPPPGASAPVRQSGYRCAGRCCRAAYFCRPDSVQPSALLFGEGLPAMEHRYSNFNQHRSLCTTTAHTDHRLLWLRAVY